jgi:hypothetical protein
MFYQKIEVKKEYHLLLIQQLLQKENKMLPEETIIISRIQKFLKESYQNIGDSMIAGSIDNMEKYKYMMGQAHAYLRISQEISNLLNPKEPKNENRERPDNVVDFGPKD